MGQVEDLWVTLRASTTQFTAGMRAAAAEGEAAGTRIRSSASGIQRTVQTGMRQVAGVSVITVAALAAGGVAAMKMATTFQASTEKIRTQAGATQTEVDRVRGSILKMAGQVGFGPEQLSESFYHVESAGYRAAQATDIVRKSAELAKIGQSNLAETTNAVVGILQSGWITGANSAGKAVSLLNAIVGAGNMKMQDLVGAMSTGIAAASKTFGVSMQSSGAAIALMTDQGVPAQMAATHLRMAISLIGAPTKAATKYLTDMGITSADAGKRVSAMQKTLQDAGVQTTQLANDLRQPDGFMVALTDLKTHMEKAGISAAEQSAVISRSFGGGKSGAAIMQMYTNLDLLKTKYGQIGAGAKNFGSDWAETQKTMQNQIDKTKARAEAWLTQMGMKLLPIASKALTELNKMFDWLGTHKAVLDAIGAAFTGIITTGLVMAAAAAWAFMAPFLLVAVPIAAVSVGLYELWERSATFRNIVKEVGSVLKTAFGESVRYVQSLGDKTSWLRQTITVVWTAIKTATTVTWHAIGAVLAWFQNGPLKFIQQELKVFSAFWNAHGQELITIAKKVWTIIWTSIRAWWEVIQAYLKVGLNLLQSIWKTAWDLIVNSLRLSWDLIKDSVKLAVNVVLDVIGTFADLLTGHWSKLWGDVKKLVSDAFTGIWNLIKDFASNALTLLYDAGADLIRGLINGIKSMAGAAVDAAKNVGKDVVNGAKSFLGIKSPSTVFHGIGQNIGQGLANGITDSTSTVVSAVSTLSTAASQHAHAIATKVATAHHKVVSATLKGSGATLSSQSAQNAALEKYVHAANHQTLAAQAGAVKVWMRDMLTTRALDKAAHQRAAQVAADPNATASQKAYAQSQAVRADKMIVSLQKIAGGIDRMGINARSNAVAAGLTKDSLANSALSKFIHDTKNHTAAGAAAASKMWQHDVWTDYAAAKGAHALAASIARDRNATPAEKARAAAAAVRADKVLAAVEKMHDSIEKMVTTVSSVNTTGGRHISSQQALMEDMPSYIAAMVGAGRASAISIATLDMTHRLGGQNLAPAPPQIIQITMPVTVTMGNDAIYKTVLTKAAQHENRNVSNGLSKYIIR